MLLSRVLALEGYVLISNILIKTTPRLGPGGRLLRYPTYPTKLIIDLQSLCIKDHDLKQCFYAFSCNSLGFIQMSKSKSMSSDRPSPRHQSVLDLRNVVELDIDSRVLAPL
jgi:hypothetical protein